MQKSIYNHSRVYFGNCVYPSIRSNLSLYRLNTDRFTVLAVKAEQTGQVLLSLQSYTTFYLQLCPCRLFDTQMDRKTDRQFIWRVLSEILVFLVALLLRSLPFPLIPCPKIKIPFYREEKQQNNFLFLMLVLFQCLIDKQSKI